MAYHIIFFKNVDHRFSGNFLFFHSSFLCLFLVRLGSVRVKVHRRVRLPMQGLEIGKKLLGKYKKKQQLCFQPLIQRCLYVLVIG